VRVLLTDPSSVTDGDYQRFVQRAQLEGLMADHLVQGEPYLALNAVVLDPAEDELLRRLTPPFATAFQRAGKLVMADRALMEEWGFPWVAAELLAAEEPRMPVVGRFDFVRDEDGRWWLLELNADTPSGIREAIVVDAIVHETLAQARPLARPNVGLGPALVAAFEECLDELPVRRRRLGLVTHTGELEDLLQMAYTEELLRAPLARRGIEVVLGDAANLRATASGLSLCGRPVGALYRYLAFETILGGPAFAAIADASAAGGMRLLNGLFGLLLQHKGLLAWLWEHRDDPRFTPEERQAIREYLPPTWKITERPADVPTTELVAKQVFGREGAEVMFGEETPAEDWAELERRRTYVVQQRIAVVEQDAVTWTTHGPVLQSGRATVGAFAVAGKWGGYYTRFGGKIITSRAKWLATFSS
jgi:glutathionylspermidine synthase